MTMHLHYDESQTILETIQRNVRTNKGLDRIELEKEQNKHQAALWAITTLQHLMMSSYLWMSLGEGEGNGCYLKKIKSRDRDECLRGFLRTAGSRCLI